MNLRWDRESFYRGGSGERPRRSPRTLLVLFGVYAAFLLTLPAHAQVTFERILNSQKEPQNWLTYSGAVNGQRYSPLTQITPANVKNLELQWVWQARSTEKFETTALVVDGVLYTIEAPNNVSETRAMKGVTGGYTTYPQLRKRASSRVASSSRWKPYSPLVAACNATTLRAETTRIPVSLAIILWLVAARRICIEITITLTTLWGHAT